MFNSFHFSGQNKDEEVLYVIHRHWFNIIINFIPIFFMTLLLLGSHLFLPTLLPEFTVGLAGQLFMFIESIFAMIIWVLLFLIWIDYYFDVWIITTKRVVDIEQKGLFSRKVSEARYDKIQDITTEVKGIIPTILNYGNVLIQTAAEKEKFVFTQIADPYGIKDMLMHLQKEHEQDQNEELHQIFHEK